MNFGSYKVVANKNSRPGASMHRRRLFKRESIHAAKRFSNAGELIRPCPPASRILNPRPSIRPNRRRIIQQKVPRSTQRVIRVCRLRHRWPWLEVVILIARGSAATHRATRRGRAAATTAVAVPADWAMRSGRLAMAWCASAA